jgi:tetratricopeptide (TPR) repeat protein
MGQFSDDWLWAVGEIQANTAGAATPTAVFDRAVLAYSNAQWDDARALFEQAAQSEPLEWQARAGLGFALLELGRDEDALEQFDARLAAHPEDEVALFGKAVALHRLGKRAVAHAAYMRLAASGSRNPELLANLICTADDAAQVDQQCRRLLSVDPEAREGLVGLATAALAREEYDDAVGLFRRITAEWPDGFETWYNLGVALHRSGRETEAADAYRTAIRVDPDRLQAHLNLGALLERAGDLDGAILVYQDALRALPESPELWDRLGRLRFAREDFGGAAAAFERSAAVSRSAAAYANAAVAHYHDGRIQAALEGFRRALEVNAACSEALSGLAAIAAAEGDAPHAFDYWRAAAAAGAVDANLSFNIGCLLHQSGDHDRSAECFRAAIAAEPSIASDLMQLMRAMEMQ